MTVHLPMAPRSIWDLEPGSTKVYQIETTNRCDATHICSYCPHEEHARTRGLMDDKTLARALEVMSNRVVSLHHFGEPLLHPNVVEIVRGCTDRGFDVGFSSNCRLLTQEKLDDLAHAGLKWLRMHTDPFGVRLSQFIVPDQLEMTEHRIEADNDAPAKEKVSFSGYVKDMPAKKQRRCSYLEDDWVVVLWDGRLALCCHDIEGTQSTKLCTDCEGYVFQTPRDWGEYDG